jgi:hypothetical protein
MRGSVPHRAPRGFTAGALACCPSRHASSARDKKRVPTVTSLQGGDENGQAGIASRTWFLGSGRHLRSLQRPATVRAGGPSRTLVGTTCSRDPNLGRAGKMTVGCPEEFELASVPQRAR